MILNIIFAVGMYPMMMIVCYVLYNCAKPQNGIMFGSKLPQKYWKEPEVEEIVERFKKECKRLMIVFAITPVVAFFSSHVSVQMTIWMIWMLAVIALINVPYIKANAAIVSLKRVNGWYREDVSEEYVEIKAAGEVRCVKFVPFMVPTALSLSSIGIIYIMTLTNNRMIRDIEYVKSFGWGILVLASLNVILYLVALWMDRQKTEVISTKSDVNVNYARAKKKIWKDFWLQASWITTAYALACIISLVTEYSIAGVMLWGCIIYTLVLLVPLHGVVKKFREIEKRYEKERDLHEDLDDDKQWIWGMFYYNPSDGHSMVNKRVGVGTTMNLATPLGKGMTLFGALVLLWIPLMCVWVMFEEFTPISLSINGDELHAHHIKLEYELPIEEIENVEIVNDLPRLTKSVGTGMDNLLKGTFIAQDGTGKCQVFLNPQNEVFIKLEADDVVYFLGGSTDEETLGIYESLQK